MRAKHMLTVLAIAVSLAASTAMAENAEQKAMSQKIAHGLKASGQLQDYRVGVKYDDGVAWLIGTVTSNEQKQIALQIARKVDGVRNVVSKLEIAGGNTTASTNESSGDFADSLKLASMQASNKSSRSNRSTQRQPQLRQPQSRQQKQAQRRPQMGRRMARRGSQMPLPAARIGQQGPSPRGMMQARGMQPRQMPMGRGRVNPANFSAAGPGMMAPMPGGMPGARPGHVPGGGVQGASYDQGNMPGYAWPSYSAQSNYAALTYPKQYSASAWPYIGPFYPYPQVPLGWRKVSLEWDDGWWFLDFNDTRTH